ncbi:hypothetical protein ALQ25_200123 [Pseudomonas coronafaciens pv. atropurpurea]|nr:hypothetical protein ALQ25_200123 [Pseudomonas coronafaciens pv. atropurpurea]
MAGNQWGSPGSARYPGCWLLTATARQHGNCHSNEALPYAATAPRHRRQSVLPHLQEVAGLPRTRQTSRLRARVDCRYVHRHDRPPANQSSAVAHGDPCQAASGASSVLPDLRHEPHRLALDRLDPGKTARPLSIILLAVRQVGQLRHQRLFPR